MRKHASPHGDRLANHQDPNDLRTGKSSIAVPVRSHLRLLGLSWAAIPQAASVPRPPHCRLLETTDSDRLRTVLPEQPPQPVKKLTNQSVFSPICEDTAFVLETAWLAQLNLPTMVEAEGFLRMIDRIEYLAQLGRLRMSVPALARQTGLSVNTVRSFLNGKDIRLSCFLAITEALGGEVHVTFARVSEKGLVERGQAPLSSPLQGPIPHGSSPNETRNST